MHLSTRIQDKRDELPLINCLTDLALDADASGFTAISLTEHHLHENQGYQNSLLFASALAPRLQQATLVLATVNPAIHHPVRLVESCNLIDQLNAGRLVVVFGSGFKDTDLVAFGRDLTQRNALYEQGIRTALDVWDYDGSGGPLEFAVGTDRGRLDVAVNPSSYRKPRPILARATLLNPAAIADAAARGWPLFTAIKDLATAREQMAAYHIALEASGHDPETIALARQWTGVGKAVHVADTDEQARSEAEAYFIKNPSGAIARNADDMICGSPDTVARVMGAFSDAGVGLMMCGFLIDLENLSQLHRSVGLFKEAVMPRVA
ncbi:LLM class flavin-dependent oxidoreductase [Pseudorhodoplanes sp.]|uniref:LLM class flavin-dependent oxidoreductase n=1 Tax=Pseudorhodoplanes sp. TaxID=1934341 RepID=UPI003D0E2281